MTKTPMDLTKLEPDAREYFDRLLKRYPHWTKYGSMSFKDGEWVPSIEVTSPSGRMLAFSFDSDSGPVVQFDKWHAHVEQLTMLHSEENYRYLFSLIDDLVSGKRGLLIETVAEGDTVSLVSLEQNFAYDRNKQIVGWL